MACWFIAIDNDNANTGSALRNITPAIVVRNVTLAKLSVGTTK